MPVGLLQGTLLGPKLYLSIIYPSSAPQACSSVFGQGLSPYPLCHRSIHAVRIRYPKFPKERTSADPIFQISRKCPKKQRGYGSIPPNAKSGLILHFSKSPRTKYPIPQVPPNRSGVFYKNAKKGVILII